MQLRNEITRNKRADGQHFLTQGRAVYLSLRVKWERNPNFPSPQRVLLVCSSAQYKIGLCSSKMKFAHIKNVDYVSTEPWSQISIISSQLP